MVLALAVLCPLALAGQCSKPITLATGQWEPYSYFDAQGHFTGIDADMVRAIFQEARCDLVELGPMPASRNLTLFFRDKIDLMTGASRTPERLKRARFSLPYRDETVGLFFLAGASSARFAGLHSFEQVVGQPQWSLLAPRVGYYGPLYEKSMAPLLAAKRLSQFIDFTQGMRMLAAGRADFMLGDASGVEHAAARQGVKVQPLPFWLLQSRVHLMFSRATVPEADVRRIDAAIERLQKRGVFDQIRSRYGGM
ncbi:ABC transporter substrate-binding protein [Massilia sp. CF038]|uniref:substrate-binding periplasmic protein n=1 Tax=Massilia sp. CF038 TaxID=1881045 RepID=UPI0009349AAF|nr:transporter substrate-binding domain-containing protein [Massilia sp. CF038]